jgi:hypothetical protein
MQNTYANECFIDELAAAANADLVEFRLKYLDPNDKRGIEVLNRAAALAKWDKRPSPRRDQRGDVVTGRGVAYCKYELARTYIAAVAEVEVKRSSGDIRVTKFYLAHDCGQIINPDGLKNQLANSGAGLRPDRPPERAPLGCRRALRIGRAAGDLKRGVRRDRRAAALRALHAGQGDGGDEGGGVMHCHRLS